MWITKLKIAIVEKNTDNINKLLNDIPELTDKSEIEEALYLLREASELLHTLQNETSLSMKKIKKNKGKMPKLTDGVKSVPTGIVRIMTFQEQGYSSKSVKIVV